MNTLKPNVQHLDFRGKATLIETNCLTTRVVTRRIQDWTKLPIPETWVMSKVVDPKPIMDTTIDQIIETDDGNLEISFIPNHRTRLTLPRSQSVRHNGNSSMFDLGSRSSVSEKPYNVSYPHTNAPSTSHSSREGIPFEPSLEPSIVGIKISHNQIPHGVYQPPFRTAEPSEFDEVESIPIRQRQKRTSPTASEGDF